MVISTWTVPTVVPDTWYEIASLKGGKGFEPPASPRLRTPPLLLSKGSGRGGARGCDREIGYTLYLFPLLFLPSPSTTVASGLHSYIPGTITEERVDIAHHTHIEFRTNSAAPRKDLGGNETIFFVWCDLEQIWQDMAILGARQSQLSAHRTDYLHNKPFPFISWSRSFRV